MKKQSFLSPRFLIQLAFLLITGLFVYSPYIFHRSSQAEGLCPLGGLESLPQLLTGSNLLNHIHKSNVVLMVALIVTTLLVGRLFCSWVCPLGTLQEWLAGIGARLKLTIHVPEGLERILNKMKYVFLALILLGTYATVTLVFRTYDPFYGLFHLANPALTGPYIVLALVLIMSVFIPRLWCRYVCPLGAFVNLLSLASLVKPFRVENKCIACGLCDKKCSLDVKVSRATVLESHSCNHCLDCIDACPREGVLGFKLGYKRTGKTGMEVNS